MNWKIPLWAWTGLGVLAYMILRATPDTPSTLTGLGANLAELAKSQAQNDPAQIRLELGNLSARATVLKDELKNNPSLGLALGMTPTQIDYAVLPPDQFRTTYGFTADAPLSTPNP